MTSPPRRWQQLFDEHAALIAARDRLIAAETIRIEREHAAGIAAGGRAWRAAQQQEVED